MGFLIRMAFWFSLVLLVLPLDIGTDAETGESVSPLQAFFAAREAFVDVAAICERKPGVCETGKAALHTIGARAREGVRIAAEMLDDDQAALDVATTTGGIPAAAPTANVPAAAPAANVPAAE
jgi:hypothetical protein